MINLLFVIIFFLAVTNALSQSEVKIGNQVWMKENLDVTTFRNGDSIPFVQEGSAWEKAADRKQPAWTNSSIGGKSCKLYNWYAVHDSRGIAPKGWHVPNQKEWKVLLWFVWRKSIDTTQGEYYGFTGSAIHHAEQTELFKSLAIDIGWPLYWEKRGYRFTNKRAQPIANNKSGFGAINFPMIYDTGYKESLDSRGYFWSYYLGSEYKGDVFTLGPDWVMMVEKSKGCGIPVRCVKD